MSIARQSIVPTITTLALSSLLVVGAGCSPASTSDTTPPQVVSTTPVNAATGVDPNLTVLTATFNEPMLDQSWSWSYTDPTAFPELTGDPVYTTTTTNTLPVKLQPNTTYTIWLNTGTYANFKDAAGNSLEPYQFTFATK